MLLNNLRKAIGVFIPLIYFLGRDLDFSIFYIMLIIGIFLLVLVLFLSYSFIEYRNFLFYIQDGQFVLQQGVLQRTRLSIPIERIQSIHLKQNIFHRIFNITALEVDSAGSKSSELEIKALSKPYARGLRDFLYEIKDELLEAEKDPETEGIEEVVKPESQKAKTLLKLSPKEVFLIGISENHIKTGFVALAVIFGYGQQLTQYVEDQVDEYVAESTNLIMQSGISLIVTLIIIFLLLSVLLSLIRTFLKFFNFEATTDSRGLKIRSGLLSIKEYQVPQNKIQTITWSSNPLRKLLGLRTIQIAQASSVAEDKNSLVEIPGCKAESIQTLYQDYFPETLGEASAHYKPDLFLRYRFILFKAFIPSIIFAAFGFFLHPWIYAVAVIWLILGIIVSVKYYQTFLLRIYPEGLKISKGWIFPNTVDLKLFKVQNVELTQSIFQERRDLATVVIHTASGSFEMPFLKKYYAHTLANFLLYKIETSNKKWM